MTTPSGTSPSHAERALQRLRTRDRALHDLARIVVQQTTATPINELASARWIASQIATGLRAATRGDSLRTALSGWMERGRARWATDERTVGDILPDGVEPPLRELLGRPFSPPERLTARIVRQDAVRDLIARVLEDSISRFGRRMRAADGRSGGFGKRAASRGRALGKGLLAAAGVAEAASELAHTLSDEFEAALDRRVKDFLGDATSRAVEQIVEQLSDPDYAKTFADFRLALLDELLATPLQELAEDLDELAPLDSVDILVQAIRAELDRPDFIDRTTERVERALNEAGDGTLGAWLEQVELDQVWTDATTELLTGRLRAVVHTDEFEVWWHELFV